MNFAFFKRSDMILEAWRVRDEHIVQGSALAKLMGDMRSSDLELALISHFGKEFRSIINDFKSRFKRLPTPDDLIWVAGVHANRDPLEIARDLAKRLNKE